MGWTCSKREVQDFLDKMNKILDNLGSDKGIYIINEKRENNKTYKFRIANNIDRDILCEELKKLNVSNYSYTDFDDNPRFKGETVWIFGQLYNEYEVYIKLKLRKSVVCMSFHESEYPIRYPYLL